MHKLLDFSSAAIASGVPPQRKLLKIDTGPYAGRMFCLYNESPNTIATTWADPPYTIWSSPYNHVTDSADYPPSACIDSQGNIYVIYVQQTTLNLIFFRLPFVSGMWTSGAPSTVLEEGAAYYPVIARNIEGDLWCAYAYYDSVKEEYEIKAKSSLDSGITWGGGPTDTGAQLSSGSDEMPYVSICCVSNYVLALYTENRSSLYVRKHVSAWEPSLLVYSGEYIDSDFDGALSGDMKLGIAFAPSEENCVYFREFDGVSLGGLYEVYSGRAISPQVQYQSVKPYIFFAAAIGNNRHLPKYAIKNATGFDSFDLVKQIGVMDSVQLFESSSSLYEDVTENAASETIADIYHPASNALLSAAGDIAYFGSESKFYCLSVILAITATGGSIVWEYHNGSHWASFSPYSGDSDLDEAETVIYLWNDTANIPDNWQGCTVNGVFKYWVRARVAVELTVPPIGTQITAVPKCDDLSLARGSV